MSTITAYHGTYWEIDTNDPESAAFLCPDPGYNDHSAVYFTDSATTARWFATQDTGAGSPQGEVKEIRVVLKGHLELTTGLSLDAQALSEKGLEPLVALDSDGDSLHLSHDREELLERMPLYGYSHLIVENNYPNDGLDPGSDICVLGAPSFECSQVAFMQPDGTWSDFIEPEQAVEQALQAWGVSNNEPSHAPSP